MACSILLNRIIKALFPPRQKSANKSLNFYQIIFTSVGLNLPTVFGYLYLIFIISKLFSYILLFINFFFIFGL